MAVVRPTYKEKKKSM